MNTDDVYPLQDVTREIIASAYEVHNVLGAGYLEKVYENALVAELLTRGLEARAQAPIEVRYKGEAAGSYFVDVVVNDAVICEIKAGDSFNAGHHAQLLNYLKATGKKVGLLIIFGPKRVQIKRMVL